MKYSIKIKESEEGFAAWCEELPGCASQGRTEEEAIQNIREAIDEYLLVKKDLTNTEKTITIDVD